jgi:hypothetical protein
MGGKYVPIFFDGVSQAALIKPLRLLIMTLISICHCRDHLSTSAIKAERRMTGMYKRFTLV